MKKITFLLLGILIFSSCEDWKPLELKIDWGDKPQPLYESITMKPLPGKESDLVEKLKEYNSLYHNKVEGTSAFLRFILSGKDSGKYMWIEGPMDFNYVNSVLSDPDMAIISRSNSHSQLIKNYCNKDVAGVVQDWNMQELENILWT